MAKTFKEMMIEKLERITEAQIDDRFKRCGYGKIDNMTYHVVQEIKELEIDKRYQAALEYIEKNFD